MPRYYAQVLRQGIMLKYYAKMSAYGKPMACRYICTHI